MTKTALFAANRGYALASSRQALIQRLIDEGWRVVLATANDEEAHYLVELGAVLEPVTFDRGGIAPLTDWRAWQRMRVIYRRWRPALAHHFHAKPVILGTLAARQVLGSAPAVVNTITGLGHAFITGGASAWVAGMGYSAALPRSDITIFQNRDDRQLFLERRWVPNARAALIAGSGINLAHFEYVEREGREGAPVVIMVGRLLGQKGIPEFVEVARRVRARWPEVRFLLAGEEDPDHPDGVTAKWLREQGSVEFLGRLSDVGPWLAEADLLLFPSYREGVPRAVMEAAATGLPVVAFNVPGVREAVRDGETGYLVPDRDVEALDRRVMQLLQDVQGRLDMGLAGRRLAENAFDIKAIQAQYWDIYQKLGAK